MIANELVRCGLTPKAVGETMRTIPDSLLARNPDERPHRVLVGRSGDWKVEPASKILSGVVDSLEAGKSLVFLNITALREEVYKHLDLGRAITSAAGRRSA
jgi:hypothetical protein